MGALSYALSRRRASGCRRETRDTLRDSKLTLLLRGVLEVSGVLVEGRRLSPHAKMRRLKSDFLGRGASPATSSLRELTPAHP